MKDRLIAQWSLFRKSNWLLTGAVCMLLVLGVLFVYSACFVSDEVEVKPLYLRQMLWIAVGAVCYTGFALLDFRRLRQHAWSIYGIAMGLLVAVLLVGRTIYGARRWLMIFGDSGFGIQPSEVAKLATIILLASRLSQAGRNLQRPGEVAMVLLLVALPAGLIIQQPDLGTAMVFVPTAMVLMFAAGVPFRYVGTLAGVGAGVVGYILAALFLPAMLGASGPVQERFVAMSGLSDYQRGRIEVFFHPEKDPLGAGWNKRQSEIAVGSGGLRGKGYLQGTQNILGFLPRSVAPTDFIYSVVAEEKGFMGSALVLVLFSVVILSGMLTALGTLDPMGRLLCAGISTLLFFHVFINIAMTVGLMPITGLPLPLLSYGGTFMVVTMSALGIIQSVYIRSDRRVTYR
jgi:rod shape determining protein RodA